MESAVKHYLPVVALMVAIVVLCVAVTAVVGEAVAPPSDNTIQVVVTSYPLYIITHAVAQDVDGVSVHNLMGTTAGCMHDYQLTPADRVWLDRADLVLMGSAEAEPFIIDVLPQLDGTVIDTVHNTRVQAHDEGEHHHVLDHAGEEHAWMQPSKYAVQCAAVAQRLAESDPAHADAYYRRADGYAREIHVAAQALTAAAQTLPTTVCVTFHDSARSFAEGLGLTVAAALTVGEDSGVSASELAAVQRVLAQHPDALLLYDDQYDIRYTAIDTLVSARQVLALDTVVAGDRVGDDWLDAMRKNAALLRREG